jgi:hypothetical protein
MRVRMTDPDFADALIAYLDTRDYIVEREADDVLLVNPLGSLRYELAASQLAEHLQAWLTQHPGTAVVLDARPSA